MLDLVFVGPVLRVQIPKEIPLILAIVFRFIKTTIECGERIQEVIQPLQSAVSELREAANGGSQSSSTENNVMTELNETCAWYNNVNRLICAVSGISVIQLHRHLDVTSNQETM